MRGTAQRAAELRAEQQQQKQREEEDLRVRTQPGWFQKAHSDSWAKAPEGRIPFWSAEAFLFCDGDHPRLCFVAKTFLKEHSCTLLSDSPLRGINNLQSQNGRPDGRATRASLLATNK